MLLLFLLSIVEFHWHKEDSIDIGLRTFLNFFWIALLESLALPLVIQVLLNLSLRISKPKMLTYWSKGELRAICSLQNISSYGNKGILLGCYLLLLMYWAYFKVDFLFRPLIWPLSAIWFNESGGLSRNKFCD